MKCKQNKAKASLFVSDLLTRAERAEYERHIAECGECRAEVGRYRRMSEMLRSLPCAEAPAELSAYVTRRLAAEESPTPKAERVSVFRMPVFQAVAAALVLAVGLGLAFYAYNATQDTGMKIVEHAEKKPAPPVSDEEGTREELITAAMPGSVDPSVYYSNIAIVDRALEGMSDDKLNELATKNHGGLYLFVMANSDAAFRRTLETSPGDRDVFVQMAQKRVILNALNRAGDPEKAAAILKEIAPTDSDAKEQLSDAALKSEAEKSGMRHDKIEKDDGVKPEEGAAEAAQQKEMMPSEEVRGLSRNMQLRTEDDRVKNVTLVFTQELTLAPETASGEKAGLDKATKSDLKLVFDSLPTMENYNVEDFLKNGGAVTLTEEEFLLLLKYLRDVGGFKVELGPIRPALKDEADELAPAAELEKKRAAQPDVSDPYAVELRIHILDK